MPIDEKTYFEHVHKDYTAMAVRVDTYATGTFDDFKLLGAVGAVLAWQPLTQQFANLGKPLTVFFGFLAIAVAVGILEARSLLKLSLIRYYMTRLNDLEMELTEISPKPSSRVFFIARSWPTWFERKHKRLGNLYYVLLYGTIVFFPTAVLWASIESLALAGIYFIVSSAILISIVLAAVRLRESHS